MTGIVEKREGAHRINGSRVSLDSVVYAFLAGQSVEAIAESFPALTSAQVHGAIEYYLAHRDEIDAYLEASERDIEAIRVAARRADPKFYEKLADARRSRPSS